MANVYRLALLFIFCFGNVAHALSPQGSWYSNNGPYMPAPSAQSYGSKDALCAAIAAAMAGPNPSRTYTPQSGGTTCVIHSYSATTGAYVTTNEYHAGNRGNTCPEGSTATGATCTCTAPLIEKDGQCKPPSCPAGQHEEGGACVPDNCKPNETRVNGVCVPEPPCPAGQTRVNGVCKKNGCEPGKSVGDRITKGDNTTYTCEDGCTVKTNPSICIKFGDTQECTGTGRQTGGTCTPGDGGGGSTPGTGGNGDTGGTGTGGTGTGGTGTGGTGTGGTGTGGTGTGGGGTGTGGTGTGGTGTGGTGTGGTGTGGTGTGDGGTGTGGTGTGGTGTGGTGTGTGTPVPNYPQPKPVPPTSEGTCPTGMHKSGSWCINDPVPPDGDGKCPPDAVKVGSTCVYPQPGGGGTGTGGGGTGTGGGGTGTGGGGTGSGDGDGDGEKGGFGGSCMSGFACEGDAIQCAIAKEQHRRNCQMFEDKTPESELYDAAKTKTGNQTGDLPGNATFTFGSDKYDTTNLLGGASCIGDITVEVMGRPVVLEVSRVCPFLEWLRMALLAVGAVLWVVIVFRS